jgi:hypothetical protein
MTNGFRVLALVTLVVTAALILAAVTRAGGVDARYAGPKTWMPGWDAATAFDGGYPWYDYDVMANKSCSCWSRVAFIKPDGSWTYSYTDTSSIATFTEIPPGAERYTKKAYCKNNSSSVYTAHCTAFTDW